MAMVSTDWLSRWTICECQGIRPLDNGTAMPSRVMQFLDCDCVGIDLGSDLEKSDAKSLIFYDQNVLLRRYDEYRYPPDYYDERLTVIEPVSYFYLELPPGYEHCKAQSAV